MSTINQYTNMRYYDRDYDFEGYRQPIGYCDQLNYHTQHQLGGLIDQGVDNMIDGTKVLSHNMLSAICGSASAAWETMFPRQKRREWHRSIFGVPVSEDVQRESALLLGIISTPGDGLVVNGGDNLIGHHLAKRKRKYAYMSYLVKVVKDSVPGIGIESEANRLVAHKRLYDIMVEDGVRPTHIHFILPLAIECVFIPTRTEISAEMLRQSREALFLIDEGRVQRHTRGGRWLFNWMGSRNSRPVVPRG